ncbi:urease accessory protein UreD [Sulfurospirillum sp. 1612]|uniref:urease accessory protein UreD n=1 Tax=Sulfurospirillum sp. 1612 TaxID=3094835 RepID=UPI002F91C6BC
MSIALEFKENIFRLTKLKLPARYYHFCDEENYIKLLCVGEGIFPGDKWRTKIALENSSVIFSTESATKVYPSTQEFSINTIALSLNNSNCEFINDELILYKSSKLIQFLKIHADKESTFFYTDILSSGRSFENFDFTSMQIRNKFFIDGVLEYYENFDISGAHIRNYLQRHETKMLIFAKLYIKTGTNDAFLDTLALQGFQSFSYTKTKKMIIGTMSAENMYIIKNKINKVWNIYRNTLNKSKFNLGKP